MSTFTVGILSLVTLGLSGCCQYYCPQYDLSSDDPALSRDITTSMAMSEEDRIRHNGEELAARFSLSLDKGTQLARTLNDAGKLQIRSEEDVADFAQRLYGLNPNQVLSAGHKAIAGDNSELNALVTQAARNFDTSPQNMRRIIMTLHGDLLHAAGINP